MSGTESKKQGIKADTESQKPGGKGGLKGTLQSVLTIWIGCFEQQEKSADQ